MIAPRLALSFNTTKPALALNGPKMGNGSNLSGP